MKKHVVSLLLLWSVVFGVWAEKGFVIQGSVDGITPQSMISLYRVDNGKRSLLDKAYVTRGRFKLTGKTAGSTAEEVYIMLSDKKSPSRTLALWVLPGAKIKVFGDNRIAVLWTVESDVAEQKGVLELLPRKSEIGNPLSGQEYASGKTFGGAKTNQCYNGETRFYTIIDV